jgi:gliding motility-associated-like protein
MHLLKALFLISSLCFLSSFALGQWVDANNGIYGGQMSDLLVDGNDVIACTYGGVYLSQNDGESWSAINTGLDWTFINSITSCNGNLFVAANIGEVGVFKSADKGAHWELMNSGLSRGAIIKLASVNNKVFAFSNSDSLFQTSNNGLSWTFIDTGITDGQCLAAADGNLYLGTNSGIYISADEGLSWNVTLSVPNVYSIDASEHYVLASTYNGIYFSNTSGTSWIKEFFLQDYYALTSNGNTVILGSQFWNDTYRSIDGGNSWSLSTNLTTINCAVYHDSVFLAGNNFGVFRSDDGGLNWSMKNSGLTNSHVYEVINLKGKLFAATINGVYTSADNGDSWKAANNGLPLDYVIAMIAKGDNLIVALAYHGIYYSNDNGESWKFSSNAQGVGSFTNHQGNLFAGGSDGIFVSKNNGVSWTFVSNILIYVSSVASHNGMLWACNSFKIVSSTDGGQSWVETDNGISSTSYPHLLYHYKSDFFAGTYGGLYVLKNGVWISSNKGLIDNPKFIFAAFIESFGETDENLFTGGIGGVFSSSDNGAKWTIMDENLPIYRSSGSVTAIGISDKNRLFAGTDNNGLWYWAPCIDLPKPTILVHEDSLGTYFTSSVANGNQWYLNGEVIANAKDSIFRPDISGDYDVQVLVGDCKSEISASKQYKKPIVIAEPILSMPNVFTPNGDTDNPVFSPIQYENIQVASLNIFDRWGKHIFHSDYLPEGWDGGNNLSAVYFYFITYRGRNGKTGTLKGWVQLIR